MVDKVWYDWQHASPANFWAFKGGSVQNLTSVQALHDYPNGMPPALSVSPTCIPSRFPDRPPRGQPRGAGPGSTGSSRADCTAPRIFAQLDSVIHADGMFPDLTVRDVMNTTGGYLCYVYE